MKNFLYITLLFSCIILSYQAHAQRIPVIQVFSSIQLNEDETITVTPYHPAMGCWGENCGSKITLQKDETYTFSDGHHAYGSITYKGIKDNKLIFENMSGFNAISFGGDVTEETKEKLVEPYTKEQFSEGREKEILDRMELNNENKEEITRLINKLGIANELLWDKYYDIEYIKFLVANGADINYENEQKKTILFPNILEPTGYGGFRGDRVCEQDSRELNILIDLGIDIHHKDENGKEVLDYINEKIEKLDDFGEHLSNGFYISNCLYLDKQILTGQNNPLNADRETCNSLPNFEFVTDDELKEEYCMPRCGKGEFRRLGGYCESCNESYEISTTAEECAKCPNRSVQKKEEPVYYDAIPDLNETKPRKPYSRVECIRDYMFCPKGTIKSTFMGNEKCASCSSTAGIETTKEECDKCPNRKITKTYRGEECILNECPDGEFRSYNTMCFSCKDLGSFNQTTEQECLKCPNRIMYDGERGQECALTECPSGTFRSLKFGSCQNCDENNDSCVALDATPEECSKCSERELVGTRCSLKVCPEGRFRIKDGTCPSCDWDRDYETTEEQCARCLGRIYKDGKCSLR